MKIAVIGKGNTGQAVIDLLGAKSIYDIFDSKNTITVEKLNKADAAIVFVSSQVLSKILPVLLASKTTIICGTTGFDYTQEIIKTINLNKRTWIVANNFSLSMIFIKEALASLGRIKELITQVKYSIKEIHHTKKLDTPSGTAISWQQWLSVKDCPISSERFEDVKGIHSLQIDHKYETIVLKHNAHDRKLFAQGAIWIAKYAIQNPDICGFYQFEKLIKEYINEHK